MGTIKTDTVTGLSSPTEVTIASNKFVGTASGTMTVVGEGGTTQTSLQQGLVKAWARLNPNTLQDSLNTSSILDNGTGDFEFNFTNSMGNANYSVVGDGNSNAGNTGVLGTNANAQNENSTSLCRFIYSKGEGIDTASDPGYVYYQLVGDLA